MIDFGIVRPGTKLFIPWNTFDSNDPSASVTITGLAVTDIEIYKDDSVTQRASDAGYALIDTDGIDIDGTTGIHEVSVDLANNTTAGFYAAGSRYKIVIASITVDAGVVNFVAAVFTIGYPNALINTTIATLASQTSFTLTSGPAENDALNGMSVLIHDVASAVQLGQAVISDYVGSTKTVTLAAATTFTAVATDNISIMGLAPLQPTVAGAQQVVQSADNDTKLTTLIGRIIGTLAAGTHNPATVAQLGALTDWLNGGRLDLILDIIAADTTTDIPALIATAQADLDIITGAAGVLLDATATSAQLVDDIWDEVLTGATHNVTNSAAKRLRAISGSILTDGTAQSGGNNTIQLASGDITINDQFRRSKVVITGGLGEGQEAIITSSVASTDTLTITPAWLINPDVTSEYQVIPAQVHSTVRNGGYDNGSVFVDTVNGTSGTQKGVNGTSSNPVDNLNDAYTIATNEMISRFEIQPGSSVVLPAASTNKQFFGRQYDVALNGADIGTSTFNGGTINGIAVNAAGKDPAFILCAIGTVTLPPCNGLQCGLFGTFTIGSEGAYTFGSSASIFDLIPIINYGVARNASTFFLQDWLGGTIEIQNTGAGTGTYKFEMNSIGGHLTINANCSATTEIGLHGSVDLTNNASGMTIHDETNALATALATVDSNVDLVLADTNELQTDWANGGRLDLILDDIPNTAEFEVRTPSASELAFIVDNAATGLPVTFTTAGGGTTTAVLNLVDGIAGSAVDDQYNGRLLVFTNGTLKGVVTDITDYVGSTTTATITAIPVAPTSANTARLI